MLRISTIPSLGVFSEGTELVTVSSVSLSQMSSSCDTVLLGSSDVGSADTVVSEQPEIGITEHARSAIKSRYVMILLE